MSQRSFTQFYSDQRYDASSAASRSRYLDLRSALLADIDRCLNALVKNVSANRSINALLDHSPQQTDQQVRFEQEILLPLQHNDQLWRRFEKRFLIKGDFVLKSLPLSEELTPLQRLILLIFLAERLSQHAAENNDLNSVNSLIRLLDFLCLHGREDLIQLDQQMLCRLKLIILCEKQILEGLGL